jgi:hypothetical protein
MAAAPQDPDELREQILLRLRLEHEVREQLALQREQAGPPAPPPPWSWLESKLGLLLLGALITGVLVPSFQFTQESLRWTRQNRYDELNLQRNGIRESLRQFLAAQAQSSELNEIGLAALDSGNPGSDPGQRQRWRQDLRALTRRRIEQNARFVVSIFHLPAEAQQSIRNDWDELLTQVGLLQETVQRLIDGGTADRPLDRNAAGLELGQRVEGVNRAYERVLSSLRTQLQQVEREGATFR